MDKEMSQGNGTYKNNYFLQLISIFNFIFLWVHIFLNVSKGTAHGKTEQDATIWLNTATIFTKLGVTVQEFTVHFWYAVFRIYFLS